MKGLAVVFVLAYVITLHLVLAAYIGKSPGVASLLLSYTIIILL